jgi:4-hydroxy-tetrahydrodipicolinate synthase
MVTPFDAAGKVDYPVLSSLVEWYIASGCSGLFAVCQSSEMYYLDEAERLEVAGFVAKQAAGRVAVVATGNSGGGTIEEQAAFVNKMAAVPGMDAVVALTCMFAAEDESEEVWKANATKLMALTTCSLGLYEVPVPYKRVLSPGLLAWCASSGRFLFHKDTWCAPAFSLPTYSLGGLQILQRGGALIAAPARTPPRLRPRSMP